MKTSVVYCKNGSHVNVVSIKTSSTFACSYHIINPANYYYSECDSRRFGVNCEKECHCKNMDENCQSNTPKGRCQSGCDPHFTGPTCQGNGFCFC